MNYILYKYRSFAFSIMLVWGFLSGIVYTSFAQQRPVAKPKSTAVIPTTSTTKKKVEADMGILLRPYADRIAIRWAPGNFSIWEKGKKMGYVIYRTEVVNGQKVGTAIKITNEPIRPVSMAKFKSITDTSQSAKNAIFNIIQDSVAEKTIEQALEREKGRSFQFAMGLVAANIDPYVADISGMLYVDRNVVSGKEYYYEIHLNDPSLATPIKTFASATVASKYEMPKPFELYGRGHKNLALIEWRTDFVAFKYAYFNIYRAEKQDGEFKRVNDLPYIGFVSGEDDPRVAKYQDTLPRIDIPYFYKIKGVTPFGEVGPESDIIRIVAKQSIYFSPVLTSATSANNKTVVLEWEHPGSDFKNTKGYFVQRTDDPLTPYKNLNKFPIVPAVKKYEDKKPLPAGYYRIVTLGVAGDSAYSLGKMVQLIDSIPPKAPIGLVAKADTNGIVILSWKPNKETDMYGYRVFKTYGKMDEWTRLTKATIADTMWRDTVAKTLGYKKVYYSVVALDGHFNPSDFSKHLEVLLPDVTPPDAPEINSYKVLPNKVLLGWRNSMSRDVAEQVLLRREVGKIDWEQILKTTGKAIDTLKKYVDTSAIADKVYQYCMQAVDDRGLKSLYSNLLKIETIGDPHKPAVQDFKAFMNAPNNVIKLEWKYEQLGVDNFVIFRQAKDGKKRQIANLGAGTREYYDRQLQPNTEYTYLIQANFKDWKQSLISAPVVVKY